MGWREAYKQGPAWPLAGISSTHRRNNRIKERIKPPLNLIERTRGRAEVEIERITVLVHPGAKIGEAWAFDWANRDVPFPRPFPEYLRKRLFSLGFGHRTIPRRQIEGRLYQLARVHPSCGWA